MEDSFTITLTDTIVLTVTPVREGDDIVRYDLSTGDTSNGSVYPDVTDEGLIWKSDMIKEDVVLRAIGKAIESHDA